VIRSPNFPRGSPNPNFLQETLNPNFPRGSLSPNFPRGSPNPNFPRGSLSLNSLQETPSFLQEIRNFARESQTLGFVILHLESRRRGFRPLGSLRLGFRSFRYRLQEDHREQGCRPYQT
jgi:hypothetical protein